MYSVFLDGHIAFFESQNSVYIGLHSSTFFNHILALFYHKIMSSESQNSVLLD